MRTDDVLAELARERGPALVGYAALLTGDRATAEDLVQEAFVRVFAVPRRGPVDRWEPYVRRAVMSVFLDERRRTRRRDTRRHLFGTSDVVADATHGVPDRVDVDRALALLPPRERACVVLRFHDDMTIPQIAQELGLAPGSVKRYLHDATARLATVLGPGAVATADDPPDHVSVVSPTTDRGGRR